MSELEFALRVPHLLATNKFKEIMTSLPDYEGSLFVDTSIAANAITSSGGSIG